MLPEETIFQSAVWNQFQNSLPGRKAGKIGTLYWTILPWSFGKKYMFINRPDSFDVLKKIWSQIIALAKGEKCVYIKIEPNWPKNEHIEELKALGCKATKFHIQPDTTLFLDLSKSAQDLLKQMKPKGRYNIKIAQKHHIEYRSYTKGSPDLAKALEYFYNLLLTTAKRDKFGIHSQSYYYQFLESLSPYSKLYLAYYQNEPIAGMIAIFYQNQAIYYYGASDSKRRNTMATYGLQWEVIQDAQKAGLKSYDFLGIAPPEADHTHPWQGVTDFKLKFGGSIYQYAGTFHYIISPSIYFFLNFLKRIFHAIKKYQSFIFKR